MIVVGIDIGLSGAFAVAQDANLLALEDLPIRERPGTAMIRREIDAKQLAFRLRATLGDRIDEAIAVLENVRGMRKGGDASPQGSSSVFAFGETKGAIRGVCESLGIETKWVEPIVWKRWFGIAKDEKGTFAREKATVVFGTTATAGMLDRVKDHNRAEACLLARYGWQKWG